MKLDDMHHLIGEISIEQFGHDVAVDVVQVVILRCTLN
jgi:hypothetical protein